MSDQPSMDRTLAGDGPERSVAPSLGELPAGDDAATIAGSTPKTRIAPVNLLTDAYAVGREIARGGMGCVLQAEDRKLARTVAMKVMLRPKAGEEEKQRFLQEARVLGQLAHPNIVPVHDVGKNEQGRLFYTMKLVQGGTLEDVIAGLRVADKQTLSRFSLTALLTIFQKVCDAVAFAHSRGIIHRDLKPQNIMVGEFGEVLVMDWGLAKILPGSPAAEHAARNAPTFARKEPSGSASAPPLDPTAPDDPVFDATLDMVASAVGEDSSASSGMYATLEGSVMGTPHYMSPEQAKGHVHDLDARSDVFLLGGILYTLLTLRPPVEAASVSEMLDRARKGEISPPSSFNAGGPTQRLSPLPHLSGGRVPAALSAVAMKALAVDRKQRYADVAGLAADVAAYQGGFATIAENASALTLLRLFIRRHRVLATAASLIVLLTLGFMAKVISSERKATASAVRAENNARIAQQNEKLADVNAKTAEANEAKANATLADLRRTAPVFYAQAKVDFEEGRFDDAIEKVGYAIELDDTNADYRLFRANLRESSQNLSEAAEDYRRVIALRSADAAAKTNLALCEKLLGETGGAELGRPQQGELLLALRRQKRLIEAAPLAALIDPQTKATKAAILARLREARNFPRWRDSNVSPLPDGTFKVSLRSLAPIDFTVLKGEAVTALDLGYTGTSDLSGLAGLPLKVLILRDSKATDLSPLRGMPLENLELAGSPVSDLSPLRGMKLRTLKLGRTKVIDLSPLTGMPLNELSCYECRKLGDLSPLQGAPLAELNLGHTEVADLAPLAGAPLKHLALNNTTMRDIAALSQFGRLEEVNLKGLPITDLAPLAKLHLTYLDCAGTKISSVAPLRGQPLRFLCLSKTGVTDLSPLANCTTLEEIVLPDGAKDVSMFRDLPRLKRISTRNIASDAVSHAAQTAEEFWKEYDAKPRP